MGNLGGIRSAALLGFEVRREVFVGTATAIALMVDGARPPAYLASDADAFARSSRCTSSRCRWARSPAPSSASHLLARVPERLFQRVVGAVILLLGVWMGYRASAAP